MTDLLARRNCAFVNPSWTIVVDGDDRFFLSFRNRHWVFEATVDNFGQLRGDDGYVQAVVLDTVRDDFDLRTVLSIIRGTFDAIERNQEAEDAADLVSLRF